MGLKWVALTIAGVLAGLAATGYWALTTIEDSIHSAEFYDAVPQQRFDAERWRRAADYSHCLPDEQGSPLPRNLTRQAMLVDLQRSRLTLDQSYGPIRELLGPPDQRVNYPDLVVERAHRRALLHGDGTFSAAQYRDLFGDAVFPNEGFAHWWDTGPYDSGCTGLFARFSGEGRLVQVDPRLDADGMSRA